MGTEEKVDKNPRIFMKMLLRFSVLTPVCKGNLTDFNSDRINVKNFWYFYVPVMDHSLFLRSYLNFKDIWKCIHSLVSCKTSLGVSLRVRFLSS